MTMLRNLGAEQNWGAIPVTDCAFDGAGNLQPASCNQDLTLLASATRTSTTSSPDQVNISGVGLVVYLNVSGASGTGGLTVFLQGKDPVSGNYFTLDHATAAVTANGQYLYSLYPGLSAEGTQGWSAVLPATWRVQVQHGDSSNYTYSVGASVLL
jgi:hypothetical protein